MKIVICSLNYEPELTGIGKYTGEMATWLANRGHEIRVITTPPYYPNWEVAVGYSAVSYTAESISGVGITRCPLWIPNRPSGIKRLIHLITFALSSFPVMLRQGFWRPDVIWVVAPALFSAPGAWLTARLCRSPVWLHVQDYEIDAAFDLGMLNGAWLKKCMLGIERWLLRRFDVVSTISSRMADRALGKGVHRAHLKMFPNWVDISAIHQGNTGDVYRGELAISRDSVIVLYSGNMGNKQGLEVLADAARLLIGNPILKFVFCGNGAGRPALEERCTGLSNVFFLDLQPLERFSDLLAMADIHLLPQRADAADLVMPSKLTGMLASGRPVVATAHEGTEVARVVDGRGLVVQPEDAVSFARAIEMLAGDAALRTRLGGEARRYAEDNLDKEAVLRCFEGDLLRLMEGGSRLKCPTL